MSNIEKIMQHIGFANPELLSKQDSAEVYKVFLDNDPAILKLFNEELNFHREVTALQSLENKNVQTPKIYSVSTQEENTQGFPFYLLEEFLNGTVLLETFSSYGYNQKCDVLYECGQLLGQLNISMSEYDLEKSGLWKYAYGGVETYGQYTWPELYANQIPGWLKNIRRENEDDLDYEHIVNIIAHSLSSLGDEMHIGLLHRDYGFRNILMLNGSASYVIDFEYAVIGDILFDLSKLVFNDLNFKADPDLRNHFFQGWISRTQIDISMDRLWLYLAIQGLGAIQWVDKQKDEQARRKNQGYRNNGKSILIEACAILDR